MTLIVRNEIPYLGIALVRKLRMAVKNVLIQLSKITTKCKHGNGIHKLLLRIPPIFIHTMELNPNVLYCFL